MRDSFKNGLIGPICVIRWFSECVYTACHDEECNISGFDCMNDLLLAGDSRGILYSVVASEDRSGVHVQACRTSNSAIGLLALHPKD